MDFSGIATLAVGQVKQYIVHRTYALPNKTIRDLREAMQKSTAEETLLLVEIGQECEAIREKATVEKNVLPVDESAVTPVHVITSQRKTMFVANVEMSVEITVTVRRDS